MNPPKATFLVGDVFEQMATLEDGSVDLVLTSPPFLALRSYLPADHPDKGKEIGSEPTPAAFLDTLLALTAEWRRLLAPHGSIAVELGDTYSGSGGAGGDYGPDGLREGQPRFRQQGSREHRPPGDPKRGGVTEKNTAEHVLPLNAGPGWPLPKSLCGIPHLYHLSLAYGRNLLTGEPSPAGQWRIRNVVAWCRPNPPVGALGDKFRPATSYMTIATPYARRYFDLDAVRTPHADPEDANRSRIGKRNQVRAEVGLSSLSEGGVSNPVGAPPLDYWEIPTHPYPGSHYATWPPALCRRPIEAMVPHKVCLTCGKPSERITEDSEEYAAFRAKHGPRQSDPVAAAGGAMAKTGASTTAQRTTLGWSDCECPSPGGKGEGKYRRGLVLDPFAGSGTTLAVATGLGRDAIGIDLDERNMSLAYDRCKGDLQSPDAARVAALQREKNAGTLFDVFD